MRVGSAGSPSMSRPGPARHRLRAASNCRAVAGSVGWRGANGVASESNPYRLVSRHSTRQNDPTGAECRYAHQPRDDPDRAVEASLRRWWSCRQRRRGKAAAGQTQTINRGPAIARAATPVLGSSGFPSGTRVKNSRGAPGAAGSTRTDGSSSGPLIPFARKRASSSPPSKGSTHTPESTARRPHSSVAERRPRTPILGVDDFALECGHVYGTAVIDSDPHQVLDVLPGRDAEPLAGWSHRIGPRFGRAELDQPFRLRTDVVGTKIKVNPVLYDLRLGETRVQTRTETRG